MAAVADTNEYEQTTGISVITDSQYEYKEYLVITDDLADATNTLTTTLADHGITSVKSVKGWKHTTNNSVIVLEQPTTSVTTGVLTITIPAGTDNDKRVYLIGGY